MKKAIRPRPKTGSTRKLEVKSVKLHKGIGHHNKIIVLQRLNAERQEKQLKI